MVMVREATFDDFESIKTLIMRNGVEFENKSTEEWAHLWKDNPVIANSERPWPIGWVLEGDDSGIVGFFGNIPVAYELKQKRLIAAVASSWVVDPPYRNHSMLLVNSYFNQKSADLFLNTTANYTAGRVFSTFFKARKIPVDSYDTVLYWITDYKRFISSALVKKGLPSNNILSFPLSLAVQTIDRLKSSGSYVNRPDREIYPLASFDERFDVFWDDLRRHHPGFICVRDSQYLNWHFKYALINKKVWIFVAGRKSHITSYAIFLRQDNPKIGLKRVRLIDFQTVDDDLTVLIEMLSLGIKRCQKEGIDTLEVVGFNSEKRNIVKGIAPHKRRLGDWFFLYKAKDESLVKDLENSNLWDPCFFDGDASLG